MKKVFCLVLAMLLALSAASALATEPVSAVYVNTTGGIVQGYRYDGVDSFLAIQFGTAERFQDAVPFAWNGVRVCNVGGEVCPQTTIEKAGRDLFNCFPNTMLQLQSEKNCLNLNVWTTDVKAETPKPVLVWLHGGGFSGGSATQFNFYLGESLAKSQDIVFVSANHRLNCLGYLDVSAYGGEEYQHSGNVGMTDIVLSLQWVQDNIANFGGDPENVTIIGQSGGGSKVTTLMGMPSAKGLFHKAVALSGGSVKIGRTTESAQEETAKVVEALGLNGKTNEEILAALTSMPYEELYTACVAFKINYGPVVDGALIPTGTFEMSKDIPLIAGNVLGEFSTNYSNIPYSGSEEAYTAGILNQMTEDEIAAAYVKKWGEEYGPKLEAAFKAAYPTHNPAEGMYIANRQYGGMVSLAKAMESYGGKVYNSVQAYSYPMYGGIVAIHTASDIPFWFDNMHDIPEFIAGDEENAAKVAHDMSNALGAFMRTGNPSTDELAWEPYAAEKGNTMVFDAENGAKSEMKFFHDKEYCDLLNETKKK